MTSEANALEDNHELDKPVRRKMTGLGRGLSALMGDIAREESIEAAGETGPKDGVRQIAIADIHPHPGQPRRSFDSAALDELAASIRTRGVIQPIIVRPEGRGFQIVAGERRWRAAQRARLHQIPAIIRDLSDSETYEIAIVENVQREDLNVIEEAQSYVRLVEDYGHSQAQISDLVGKSRSHIANLMRLLDLPEDVRQLVAEGQLSMGHARALITAPDPSMLAHQAVKQGLSVRAVEKLVRAAMKPEGRREIQPRLLLDSSTNADIRAVETHLSDLLGLNIRILARGDSGAGSMTIDYANLDQLDLLCQRLTGERI